MEVGVRLSKRAIGVLGFAIVALLTVMVGPAAAHDIYGTHRNNIGWIGSGHDHLNVEDVDCNGNAAYAEGYGQHGFTRVWDSNGCAQGHGHGDGVNFYMFRVCENRVGCGSWFYHS